ncbi:hypothetical protein C8Q77DRAFT_900599 [Trametes polyzona]|nr:hypothetical protein C8Q77DRAFT_900599 [Trametes polyzona]
MGPEKIAVRDHVLRTLENGLTRASCGVQTISTSPSTTSSECCARAATISDPDCGRCGDHRVQFLGLTDRMLTAGCGRVPCAPRPHPHLSLNDRRCNTAHMAWDGLRSDQCASVALARTSRSPQECMHKWTKVCFSFLQIPSAENALLIHAGVQRSCVVHMVVYPHVAPRPAEHRTCPRGSGYRMTRRHSDSRRAPAAEPKNQPQSILIQRENYLRPPVNTTAARLL